MTIQGSHKTRNSNRGPKQRALICCSAQVKEVAERCRVQKQHLEFLGAHLPRHLPEQPIAFTAPEQTNGHDQAASQARQQPEAAQKPQGPEEGASSHAAMDKRKKLVHAPRRYAPRCAACPGNVCLLPKRC